MPKKLGIVRLNGEAMTWRKAAKLLDAEIFLPVAAKHGHELRSIFLWDGDEERSPDAILEGLQDGELYFGDDDCDEP